MKPVGQRTVIDDGEPADEDAVLMRTTFELPQPYSVLSPVHIPRGFTKAYIAGKVVEDLGARIARAHAHFARSEERRVGKECRARGEPGPEEKNDRSD